MQSLQIDFERQVAESAQIENHPDNVGGELLTPGLTNVMCLPKQDPAREFIYFDPHVDPSEGVATAIKNLRR